MNAHEVREPVLNLPFAEPLDSRAFEDPGASPPAQHPVYAIRWSLDDRPGPQAGDVRRGAGG